MNFLLALGLFLGAPAQARVCEDLRLPVQQRIAAPDGVSFFMRASQLRTLGFATSVGNRILHLKTGKFAEIEGEVDPVPSPDGEIVAVPVQVEVERDGSKGWEYQMKFYREVSPGKFAVIHVDKEASFTYQSLGTLAKSRDRATYRMLYQGELNQIFIRDYDYDLKTHEMKPKNERRVACAHVPQQVSLPMISSSGREFSYYDNKTLKTYVYEIGEKGECRKKEEFAATLGKMDFSPDGKRLVFHADAFSDQTFQFAHPLPEFGLGLYLYDRGAKRVTPLHVARSEDAYYPVFLNNEEIAFVSSRRGDKYDDRTFFINTASLKGVGRGCRKCFSDDNLRRLGSVVGHMYGEACLGQKEYQAGGALMTFMSLNPDRCRELVRGTAEEKFQTFVRQNFTPAEALTMMKRDLFAQACDALAGNPKPGKSSPLDAPAGAEKAN